MNKTNRSLLSGWPGDQLSLDTTTMPLAQVKKLTLAYLGLAEIACPQKAVLRPEQYYIGTYQAQDRTVTPHFLKITQENGALKVDTYWPKGCPLVADSPWQFHLQATSFKIEFDAESNLHADWLTYDNSVKIVRYDRLPSATSFNPND